MQSIHHLIWDISQDRKTAGINIIWLASISDTDYLASWLYCQVQSQSNLSLELGESGNKDQSEGNVRRNPAKHVAVVVSHKR